MSDKRLVKGEKILFGVCSGVANYFGIDPTIVRVGVGILTLCYGFGIIPYLIGAIIIPNE